MPEDDNATPASPSGYKPIVAGFPEARVDTADPRYVSAAEAAHKGKLSQSQFSQMLDFEAARVIGSQRAAPPASAPAAKPAIPSYAGMTMAQKLQATGNL